MKHLKEIGKRADKSYLLINARMCDVGSFESKTKRWFLTVDEVYVGEFATKKDAYKYIDNL